MFGEKVALRFFLKSYIQIQEPPCCKLQMCTIADSWPLDVLSALSGRWKSAKRQVEVRGGVGYLCWGWGVGGRLPMPILYQL